MRFAPPDKQGVASGILNMIKSIGQVLGVSLFETIFSDNITGSVNNIEKIAPYLLVNGFQKVYILGGIICIISALSSLLINLVSYPQENS
jgi:hypothetical protein